jgi:hypothetical protein
MYLNQMEPSPLSRALLVKLIETHAVKFPAIYGTRLFIAILKRALL